MRASVISSHSDEQLIENYLNGDNNALGILYSRYYDKVYHKCLSFTKNQDDAFDFAQDVLIKAFNKAKTFRGESKFSTWVFSVTQNHCISKLHRINRVQYENMNLRSDLIEYETDFESRKERETLEMEIDNYLAELSDSDKEILEMKYRQNLSLHDLQEKLDLSLSAVKMRLLRARKKVEQIYKYKNLSVSLL